MILYNPEDGAPIHDISFKGVYYFMLRDNLEFKPGDIIKIEDEVGEFIKEVYGFVKEVSAVEAKNIKDRKERSKFKCEKEGCDFSSDDEKKLKGHSLHHQKEDKMDAELGIRIVSGRTRSGEIKRMTTQDLIDADAESESGGLVGEGLVEE